MLAVSGSRTAVFSASLRAAHSSRAAAVRYASNAPLPAARALARAARSTPISHVIIIIQENRSFDNLFATFPRRERNDRSEQREPMPTPIASPCATDGQPVITAPTTVPLTKVDLLGKGFPNDWDWNQDLAHDYPRRLPRRLRLWPSTQPNASNPCKMDGFDRSYHRSGRSKAIRPARTRTSTSIPTTIQPYWDMAKQYVLADNAFQTQGSESFTAHQDLIAGGTAIDPTTASSTIRATFRGAATQPDGEVDEPR